MDNWQEDRLLEYIEIHKAIIAANLKRKTYRVLEQILITMFEEDCYCIPIAQVKIAKKLNLDSSDISKALKELQKRNVIGKIKGDMIDKFMLIGCTQWVIEEI